MSATSRAKGSRAELEVAALCTEWWAAYEPNVVIKRTPGSGGWAHASAFKSKGDLVATTPEGPSSWPFFVEVKRFERWSIPNLRAGKASPVWAHWRKAAVQAAEEGKLPLLWVRKSRSPWYVVGPAGVFERMGCHAILTTFVSVRNNDLTHKVALTEGPILLATEPGAFFKAS